MPGSQSKLAVCWLLIAACASAQEIDNPTLQTPDQSLLDLNSGVAEWKGLIGRTREQQLRIRVPNAELKRQMLRVSTEIGTDGQQLQVAVKHANGQKSWSHGLNMRRIARTVCLMATG